LDVDRKGVPQERERAREFHALVLENSEQNPQVTILLHCLFLATRWHVEHGGICIHSAAVARGREGFLFLGPSMAGKTTVSCLSRSVGYPVLGDDLNFVVGNGQNAFLLAAAPGAVLSPVGYSMFRPHLRGIFNLVKDDGDALVLMSRRQTARTLLDGFVEQTPNTRRLPDQVIGLAFRTCGTIARVVPGYELHFRSSPDFWKVIDEQLPD
jgi:hypothetical protein